MKVDGQTYTQPLTVAEIRIRPRKRHRAVGRDAARISNDITQVSELVNRIEWLRKQLEDSRPC